MQIFSEKNKAKADRCALYVLAMVYAVAGSVGVLSGGIWAAIGIAGALLTALLLGLGQGRLAPPDRLTTSFVALLLGVATLSCFQAVDISLSLYALLKLFSILIPLLLLASPDIQKTGLKLLILIPALSVLSMAMIDGLSGLLIWLSVVYGKSSTEVTKLNRGYSYVLMLFIPLFAYLIHAQADRKRNWLVLTCLLVVMSTALFLSHSRATQMGALLSTGVFAAAWLFPTLVMIGLVALSVLSVGWPWMASYVFSRNYEQVFKLPDSWLHRIEIWDYSFYRIIERPLLGHGIGGSSKIDWSVPHGPMYVNVDGAAAHSHNAIVQLWVELGALGAGVGLLMASLVLYRIWRLPAVLRPYGAAAFLYTFCLLMSAYNFWTDSLWAAMALTCFVFAVLARHFGISTENRAVRDQ